MSRLARMVVPGLPHRVTQRGNRREAIFFEYGDQQIYCDLLAEHARKVSCVVSWTRWRFDRRRNAKVTALFINLNECLLGSFGIDAASRGVVRLGHFRLFRISTNY
jgi:hypothetical protein